MAHDNLLKKQNSSPLTIQAGSAKSSPRVILHLGHNTPKKSVTASLDELGIISADSTAGEEDNSQRSDESSEGEGEDSEDNMDDEREEEMPVILTPKSLKRKRTSTKIQGETSL
jgi:hypothetical protein